MPNLLEASSAGCNVVLGAKLGDEDDAEQEAADVTVRAPHLAVGTLEGGKRLLQTFGKMT